MTHEANQHDDDPRPLELCERDYAAFAGSEPDAYWTPNPYHPPVWFRPDVSDDRVPAPEFD